MHQPLIQMMPPNKKERGMYYGGSSSESDYDLIDTQKHFISFALLRVDTRIRI